MSEGRQALWSFLVEGNEALIKCQTVVIQQIRKTICGRVMEAPTAAVHINSSIKINRESVTECTFVNSLFS